VSEPANPSAAGTELAAQAAGPATTTVTGTGISFDFTYLQKNYTAKVYAQDEHGQYGFTVTETPTTPGGTATIIASLIYAPVTSTNATEGWEIAVALPTSLQVDSNLTVNALTVNITKGTVQPLS
jgi:hypothetical protein